MEEAKVRSRRRHGAELKERVLSACAQPGASVAQVALAHGLNADLVHKWRRQAEGAVEPAPTGRGEMFIPVAMPSSLAPVARDIRIELRRGAMAVNVAWPCAAAGECAAWLREILR